MCSRTSAKLLVVGFGAVLSVLSISPVRAAASTAGDVPKGSVEISPVCADASRNLAVWRAFNHADQAVPVQWTNLDTQISGSYTVAANASPDSTYFYTNYQTGLNNQTRFDMPSANDSVSRNAQSAACDASVPLPQPPVVVPPAPACVSAADIYGHLTVTQYDRYRINVTYDGKAPLCEAVPINFSSYVILNPAYNGGYLQDNPTAVPQLIIDDDSQLLTNDQTSLDLNLTPDQTDRCLNIQTDVYHGELVLAITDTTGHGDRNIKSWLYPATAPLSDCLPAQPGNPGAPGNSGGSTNPGTPSNPTPVTPVQPAKPVAAGRGTAIAAPVQTTAQTTTPVVLPDTGANYLPAALVGLGMSLFGFVASFLLQKRRAA